MSTTATGRIVDANGKPYSGSVAQAIHITVRDASAMFPFDLAHGTCQGDGTFSLTYPDDFKSSELQSPRKIGLQVLTKNLRQLYHKSQDDIASAELPFGDIQIGQAEITRWTVTLNGSSEAVPVREGNAVRMMIDNETAWGHVKDRMLAAMTSINVMQLEFDVPQNYDPAPPLEHPEIVVSFGSPVPPDNPRAVLDANDYRPERILLQKAQQGKKVRVLMPSSKISWGLVTFDLLLLFIPLLLVLAFNVCKSWKLFSLIGSGGPGGSFGSLQSYLKQAIGTIDAETFKTTVFNVVHAKLVMIDDSEALVLGSPFSQSYFDNHAHNVFDPRRGSASGVPVHDVSMAARGPAVKDMHEAFRRHYNVATQRRVNDGATTSGSTTLTSDSANFTNYDIGKVVQGPGIPDNTTIVSGISGSSVTMSAAATATGSSLTIVISGLPPIAVPAAIATPDPSILNNDPMTAETITNLQLVRTLNGGAFPPPLDQGEQGVLEGYLRAIEQATRYIYLENQYFTNVAIADALVEALKDSFRPNLQVIFMLNVTPDIPLYPVWQSHLIERIRKGAGDNASRVDFFTAWTHNAPDTTLGGSLPMIMANYLHSKIAFVDDVWATVGSANLDGASLDAFQLLHPLQFGDNRNHELNYLIFNGIDGHPKTSGVDAIDLLRRGLWSEHLGMDPADPQLAKRDTPNPDWLTLWRSKASGLQAALVSNPATIDPTFGRVLRYPPSLSIGVPWLFQFLYQEPNPERAFLKSSNIPLKQLQLVDKVRSFKFFDGKWK
jgi:phosphatidylserine/phosphatidylglycerophosphate/cardiolipin synthase-like enzyme